MARQSYEKWLKRGIYMANHMVATSRKVYSFAMEMGYAEYNPFSTFKCKVTKPRKVVWTREQITQMLKDRIARFKRDNAHIWEKPSRLFKEQPKEPEKRELTPAEKIKRDLGF